MFSNTVIDLFNSNESIISILVFEESDKKIYGDFNKKTILGDLNSILFKLIKLEGIYRINNDIYYKIYFSDNVFGYISKVNPIFILPKARQQVKYTPVNSQNDSINKTLNIKNKSLEIKKSIITFSTMYAVYKEELFEGIVYGKEFLGFVPTKNLSTMQKLSKSFFINKGSKIYADSSLTKELATHHNKSTKFKSSFFIPDEKAVRFNYSDRIAWVSIENTNLGPQHIKYRASEMNEALYYTIIYQLKEKLRKSHLYYSKLLKKEMKNLEV